MGVPDAAASGIALALAMLIATLLSMLVGELVPKNMAIAKSFEIGKAVARPQLVFTAIFKPAIVVLNGFSNKVLNLFGMEAKEEISGARSPAELASLVRRSAAMGTLDEGTATFVARTLSFSERTAADVMTPRMQVETVESTQSVAAVVDVARRTGFSRFPGHWRIPRPYSGCCPPEKGCRRARSTSAPRIEVGAIMTDVLVCARNRAPGRPDPGTA